MNDKTVKSCNFWEDIAFTTWYTLLNLSNNVQDKKERNEWNEKKRLNEGVVTFVLLCFSPPHLEVEFAKRQIIQFLFVFVFVFVFCRKVKNHELVVRWTFLDDAITSLQNVLPLSSEEGCRLEIFWNRLLYP